MYDAKHVIKHKEVDLTPDLQYEERPEAILDRKIQKLRNKEVVTVKVLWRHHGGKEATWELESRMQEKYPEMFTSS